LIIITYGQLLKTVYILHLSSYLYWSVIWETTS